MTGLSSLIRRNSKLFFKDKGMFFTSLITPAILLVLYVTFLGKVYHDSFAANLPSDLVLSEGLIEATVGGQLLSSLLAVSCVTVAFCANFLMVQDKVTGARRDLTMTPVTNGTLALGYYIASFLSTLLVCLVAFGAGLLYLSGVGWYLSLADILLILLDIVLLTMFGTALSSLINVFLSTQGQMSAIGTIVSAGYGFICGAYMPISNFSEGLQKVLSFLPGTYGTSLIRNHCMRGVFAEMEAIGFPSEVVTELSAALDCRVKLLGSTVSIPAMYLILGGFTAALLAAYVALSFLKKKQK